MKSSIGLEGIKDRQRELYKQVRHLLLCLWLCRWKCYSKQLWRVDRGQHQQREQYKQVQWVGIVCSICYNKTRRRQS
jgi:hypothetical protein